jgi:hypothetical protein
VVIPHGKRPVGRSRRRWEDKIKMDFQELGWRGMHWIDLTQDRETWPALKNAVNSLQVPKIARTCQVLRKDCAPWS